MNWNKVIFLAHASEDKPFVRKLYRDLKDAGLEPWLDEENIMPGENWENKIQEAIKNSRFLLACLSSKSVAKDGFIQVEFKRALNELERKTADSNYFIPVLIEDVYLPNISVGAVSLGDYHAEKIFTSKGLGKLLNHLRQLASIDEPIKQMRNPVFGKIKTAVAEGQLEKALTILNEYVSSRDSFNGDDVIMLMSRFNNIKRQNMQGSLSQEHFTLQSNQIIHALLELTKNIEAESDN